MLKYSILVYHRDYEQFLIDLQGLGVVDIIGRDVQPDEETVQKMHLIRQIRQRITFLKRRKVEPVAAAGENPEALDILNTINQLESEKDQVQTQLNSLQKEINNLLPWDDFSPGSVARLKDAGITVRLYSCSVKKFRPEWSVAYTVEVINTLQSTIYFVVFQESDQVITIDAEEIKMPSRSLSEMNALKDNLVGRLQDINRIFDGFAAKHIGVLEAALASLESQTDFSHAVLSARKEADDKLMILQGWVPVTRKKDLLQFLDSTFTFYLSSKPGPEDKVPVLLRNSSFAKLFEPIGKLFSLPAYNEIDLTPFFAPFFMMFFGFCMADAGYGLVIFLGSTVLKLTQDRKNHALFSIVQLFGLSTMFFGLLFGTFFGVSLLEIESLGEVRKYILNNKQIFTLSIMVGLFQILFGTGIRAVNMMKQSGFVYGLTSIGWILLILGLMDLLFLKAGGIISQIVIYSGIFLIVFFSNPKAGIFGRIGRGLWDLYGVTGIFGDALSYVRLFALGASSSILGFVINDIAFKIKDVHPVFGWIICIIFLVLGHTLNMAISALGSFVHPMRLTFVEFYRNAGFAGGGKSYKPFSTKH